MKNFKKLIQEEVEEFDLRPLFEDKEEFDPFGHIDKPEETEVPFEVNEEEDCILGISKGNAKIEWPFISLPAGYTCPFAKGCKTFPAKWKGTTKKGEWQKPDSWDKNYKMGPDAEYLCYAGRAQAQYPGANISAFNNLNLLKKFKDSKEMANLIVKSIRHHGFDGTDLFRIHEAGDFFSQTYFDSWIEVAKQLPGTLFYAYTVSLPFWAARKDSIPRNFKLIASWDDSNSEVIEREGLRYARVVSGADEARELGLRIDVDDMLAWGSDESFALPLHGSQPKGSEAAKTRKQQKVKDDSGQSFDDKIKSGKKRNQSTKDRLRDQIRTTLRTENLDWVKDVEPYVEVVDYKDDKFKNVIISQLGDYSNIRIGDTIFYMGDTITVKMVQVQSGREIVTLKNNRTNKKFHVVLYDPIPPEWEKELPPLGEDLDYWGYDGKTLGPIEEDSELGGSGRDLDIRGHREYDKDVYVHRNLNAPPYFSVKQSGGATGGKVIGYDTSIHLKDVKFIVGEKGNQEVKGVEFGGEGKSKNVHAGAVGKHVASGGEYNTEGWTPVRYNPRDSGHSTFVISNTNEPIHNVKEAILKNEKEVWVKL
jgi:hypothetical protein